MLAVATPILPAPIFVPYEAELQRGTLLDRRDRFIANVRLPAGDVEAHCVNVGTQGVRGRSTGQWPVVGGNILV